MMQEINPRNYQEMPIPIEEQPLYGIPRPAVVLPADRTGDTAPVIGGAFFRGGVLVDCNGQAVKQAEPDTAKAARAK
jgi:hypothetical protein